MDPTDEPHRVELAGIHELIRQTRFAEALKAAQALAALPPRQREATLLAARALRHLGRLDEALGALAELELREPRFSRLYEERGLCYVAMRQAQPAISAFLAAVNRNNALPASWTMLEGLYRLIGEEADSRTAASHVATLRGLPREVVVATGLFMDGELDEAEPMIRGFLLAHGDHIEAMRLLARIGLARRVFDDPALLLAAVLELAPGYALARAEYAEALIELHRYEQAREQLERLMREDPPGRLRFQGLYATACAGLGEHERAIALYQQLLTGAPTDAALHLSIAHAQKTVGRPQEAIASYRQAASCRPDFGDAYWSLANLKTYRFTAAELAHLRALTVDTTVAAVDRVHALFALGKALEDGGDYEDSFRCYDLGNTLKQAESRYNPRLIEANTRRQIEVCTRGFFAARAGWGLPDPDPIFIVGLPRAGSTLLEQILASHSQVEGTLELPNVQHIVATLRGRDPDPQNPRYPGVLTELSPAEVRALGKRYLADTRIHRSGRPFFIDKMPNNFRHLGLIRLMLPNAKIIDARREPMACCFSNLKQLFATGQEFTYGIENIARYYRTYLELMRHWDEVLPLWILRVQHEEVVEDLEGSVRRILSFCGLEFETRCIEFHKTVRSVRTASSEQVRRPLNRDGLDQWRHFEPSLGPLRAALGDAVTRYRH